MNSTLAREYRRTCSTEFKLASSLVQLSENLVFALVFACALYMLSVWQKTWK